MADIGGAVLCKKSASDRIVLRGARFVARDRPRRLRTWVRTVSPGSVAGVPRARRKYFLPFNFATGSLPDVDHYPRLLGSFTTSISGVVVGSTCAQKGASETRLTQGMVPHTPLQELIVQMGVGPEGAYLSRGFLDFTLNGSRRTVEVNWWMAACGSAIERKLCPGRADG